jgi:rhombotail lipoprotein
MKRTALKLLATLPLVSLLVGCAASAPSMAPAAPAQAHVAPAPAPLEKSYFAKDVTGGLTEGDLQRVLESPIDLQVPARVGVVPLSQPFDAHGKASITTRAIASRDFANALIGNPHFSHVSDISTDLPNTGGIEGLRVLAARYRMRYLLLYTERFEDSTHANGLAALYPTVVGMFVVPGVTVESQGLAQADLIDVRSGTVLFSVVQPMHVSSKTFMIGAARAHRELQAKAAADAAKELAKRVIVQTNQIVAYADEMSAPGARERHPTRLLPAPVLAEHAPAAKDPVARP